MLSFTSIIIISNARVLIGQIPVSSYSPSPPTPSNLSSTQEETDTRVVLYALMSKEKYQTIRIHIPDSDIFFILLFYVHWMDETTLLFDTGKGNKRRLINIKDIARSYSEEYRSSLLGLHAFCGCDTTSAFKGKGHVGPIKLLKKYPRFMRPLSQLGIEWEVSKGLLDELDEFTCAIYGHNGFSSVDKLRVNKFKQKCEGKATDASRNIDLSLLPPCKKALEQHIKRVNYQVGIWKRSHEAKPVIPHPDGHGWIDEDGNLEPLWFRREELIPE